MKLSEFVTTTATTTTAKPLFLSKNDEQFIEEIVQRKSSFNA